MKEVQRPLSKPSDGKWITLNTAARQPAAEAAARLAAVNGQHTLYNADTASSRKKL